MVVAETEAAARDGAALVAVTYAELPAIMSIDDAVDAGSFFEVRRARCGARAFWTFCRLVDAGLAAWTSRRGAQGKADRPTWCLRCHFPAEGVLRRGRLGCMGPAGELVQRLKLCLWRAGPGAHDRVRPRGRGVGPLRARHRRHRARGRAGALPSPMAECTRLSLYVHALVRYLHGF